MKILSWYRGLPVLRRMCVLLGVLGLIAVALHLTGHGSSAPLLLSATIVDSQFPSLVNVSKRLKPRGGVETMIAELLSTLRPELDDIPMLEGNLETGTRSPRGPDCPLRRAGPSTRASTRPSRDTAQYVEGCALYEEHSNVDVDLALASGNPAAFRHERGLPDR
jgi:hypothetical protein